MILVLFLFSAFLVGGFASLIEDKTLTGRIFKVLIVIFFITMTILGLKESFSASSLDGYLGIAGMIAGGVIGYLWGRELRI